MKHFLFFSLYLAAVMCFGTDTETTTSKAAEHYDYNITLGIPIESDILLEKKGFFIGYSHKYRQALWISYILTSENLQSKQVKRTNKFKPDPEIKLFPVTPKDYTRTGFDRGHLAPAADMAYSWSAMDHSFLMSNISPQRPGCNRGIWKRLENSVRKWALKEGQLYIVTGPIFMKRNRRMGNAKLPIPKAFYKVILDMTEPMKMIAFIIPNTASKKKLQSFAMTVDEVEKITGYNFFSELDDQIEDQLESQYDFSQWQ